MKTKKLTKSGLLVVALAACGWIPIHAQTQAKQKDKEGFLVKSYKIDNLGYGYEIIDGPTDKILIRQTIIPCIQGNHRFKTEQDAHKTGVHVATLMGKGVFPPSVTMEHLDSLKINLIFENTLTQK